MNIRASWWTATGAAFVALLGGWAAETPASPAPASVPPEGKQLTTPADLPMKPKVPMGGAHAPRGRAPDGIASHVVKLQGQAVRGSGGEKLGEIADVVVDVRSGEIPFVLVASATGPEASHRLRLVPVTALSRAANGSDFTVPFAAVSWRKLDSIDSGELAAGALVAFETQRQEIGRALGLARSGAEPSRLFLGSHLRGKALHNPTEIVGRIEGVVAAPDQLTALAVVKTPEPRMFLVPMAKLQLPSFQADHFTTRLTRNELESGPPVGGEVTALLHVRPEIARILGGTGLSQSSMSGQTGYASASGAAAAGLGVPSPPQLGATGGLAPTGRDGEAVRNEQIEVALARVRSALAGDGTFPTTDIQVEVAEGRLVLRGKVPGPEVRQRIEQRAKQAAPAAGIDNQLVVDGP